MQNFTYHCHTNALGIFDGRNSAEEMIAGAEALGFSEIGISNHLICNPHIQDIKNMNAIYFGDYNRVEDIYKRNIEDIREAASKHKIKVLVGFEVDYFNDTEWLNFFEKMRCRLEADYFIGSSHLIYSSDYKTIIRPLYLQQQSDLVTDDIARNGLRNYWKNIMASIRSGYFDFIAHIDLIKNKGFCTSPEWQELKLELVETFASTKTPYELNTKGMRICNEMYPSMWFIEQLGRRKVPVLISDDAHSVSELGDHFEQAESLLASVNYPVRFHF